MRKATLFWLGMAALCGTILFHTSQEASDARQRLRVVERDMLREEESLRVLHAEWSYLNQPERLEKLAREHLQLQPLQGRQFARVADINERIDESMIASAAAQEMHSAFEPAAGDIEPDAAPSLPTETAKPAAKPAASPSKYAPIAQPVVQMAPKPQGPRGFTDVMKSLGVDR